MSSAVTLSVVATDGNLGCFDRLLRLPGSAFAQRLRTWNTSPAEHLAENLAENQLSALKLIRLTSGQLPSDQANSGAHDRNRTGDLFLTKEVLCRLSYMGILNADRKAGAGDGNRTHTISLEG